MHGSIWRFDGDPHELLRRYDALVAEIPAENMRLHVCLRDRDGIVLVDTCPSKEVFDGFFASEGFRTLRERHGLPEPSRVEDLPVHAAGRCRQTGSRGAEPLQTASGSFAKGGARARNQADLH
jgi:hypothetical protein